MDLVEVDRSLTRCLFPSDRSDTLVMGYIPSHTGEPGQTRELARVKQLALSNPGTKQNGDTDPVEQVAAFRFEGDRRPRARRLGTGR